MRLTTNVLGLVCLVSIAACSDDGLAVQNLNSSTSGSDTSPEPPDAPTTSQDGDTGPAGTGDSTSGPSDPSDTESPPSDTEGTATGELATGTETGSTSTEGSTGTGDTGTTGDPCMPITDDPSGIAVDCLNDLDCPAGYTCQPFEGFAFQMQCQILCTDACECPPGLSCNPVMDKSGASWSQCE